MAELVRNVRSAQAPARPGARLEEDTVVAALNTIHEIVSDSPDNARSLLQARGVPALVALVASRWAGVGSWQGLGALPWGDRGGNADPAPGPSAASQCVRRRQRHTCCRLCGATKSFEEPCRGMAGPRHASRCGLRWPSRFHFARSGPHLTSDLTSCVLCLLSQLLPLLRGSREHQAPGVEALMTAHFH
jgi:hypothetical protein